MLEGCNQNETEGVGQGICDGKDQFDLDYAIIRERVEEVNTRYDLINYVEEKMNYVTSRVANESTRTLMEELCLI